MVRVRNKDGYIGARVRKRVETAFNQWTADNLKSKSSVIEFLVDRFLEDERIRKEYVDKCCPDKRHC